MFDTISILLICTHTYDYIIIFLYFMQFLLFKIKFYQFNMNFVILYVFVSKKYVSIQREIHILYVDVSIISLFEVLQSWRKFWSLRKKNTYACKSPSNFSRMLVLLHFSSFFICSFTSDVPTCCPIPLSYDRIL